MFVVAEESGEVTGWVDQSARNDSVIRFIATDPSLSWDEGFENMLDTAGVLELPVDHFRRSFRLSHDMLSDMGLDPVQNSSNFTRALESVARRTFSMQDRHCAILMHDPDAKFQIAHDVANFGYEVSARIAVLRADPEQRERLFEMESYYPVSSWDTVDWEVEVIMKGGVPGDRRGPFLNGGGMGKTMIAGSVIAAGAISASKINVGSSITSNSRTSAANSGTSTKTALEARIEEEAAMLEDRMAAMKRVMQDGIFEPPAASKLEIEKARLEELRRTLVAVATTPRSRPAYKFLDVPEPEPAPKTMLQKLGLSLGLSVRRPDFSFKVSDS